MHRDLACGSSLIWLSFFQADVAGPARRPFVVLLQAERADAAHDPEGV